MILRCNQCEKHDGRISILSYRLMYAMFLDMVLPFFTVSFVSCKCGRGRSKRDGTRAKTGFGLSAKRPSPLKWGGGSGQLTTDSRGVRISGWTIDRPCSDVQCKAAGYPLHSHLSP